MTTKLFLRAHVIGLALAIALPARTEAQAAPAADPGWPRTFSKDGNSVVLHQPQVDSWTDHETIQFRSAVAVTLQGASEPALGVVAVKAQTLVDDDAGTVLMTNLQADVRFPDAPASEVASVTALVQELLKSRDPVNIALSRVLAYMHGQSDAPVAALNLAPPPIFSSEAPAILVVSMGALQFKPVPGTVLMFAVNTNWPLLLDETDNRYYLLDGNSWLTASDPVNGPWSAAGMLPPEFSRLPASGNWQDVSSHVPGQPLDVVPRVFTSREPAELIVTDGPPLYSPIPGTRLMYVSNPQQPLFLDQADNDFYFLVAGRWFRAASLSGPWSAASSDLPAEFAKIPADSPMASVLASVPATQEAEDAVLLAAVPHKATVDLAQTQLAVSYDGPPKFVPIGGTSLQYAVNTPYEVVLDGDRYFCCYQAVWFTAGDPAGPWTVCTSVPAEIYTIPATCPLYNVTFVHACDATPTTVVYGYTAGYSGEYVASNGALMFGLGMQVGALIDESDCWYPCSPCYYSYGCAAHYDYDAGCYCRGAQHYGPNGGAGWGSSYNPSTGIWSRSAYAYGAAGSASVHQAYNPFTNTFASHATATNGYQSWGSSVVQHGSQWAATQHTTGPAGVTQGWAETSSGRSATGVKGTEGNALVSTGSGDLYASHDGNVYRKTDDGSWQMHQNGGWQTPPAATPASSGAAASHPGASSGNAGGEQAAAGQLGDRTQGAQSAWGNRDTQASLDRDASARNAGNWMTGARSGGFGRRR